MADSLLSEVDADVRAERMEQLWHQYRKPLFFAVVAIIAATAAMSIWQNYQEQRGGALLLQLTSAEQLYTQGKFAESEKAFAAVAEQAHGDILPLAQLWQARALTSDGKTADAIALLKTASTGKTGLWSDLACLRLASLDDSAATCLADKKDSPLANQRREWHAANLWEAGDKTGAIAILEQLMTSPDTSEATRDRVSQSLATLRAEMAGE